MFQFESGFSPMGWCFRCLIPSWWLLFWRQGRLWELLPDPGSSSSLPCWKQPRLYCLACGPFPLKAQTKIKVPSLRLFLSGDPNHNDVRVTNASLTWVNTFSIPWFLCLMIPGRMLRYSYLFPGPKHPAGPASFLDLTLNGLNTRLSSTR